MRDYPIWKRLQSELDQGNNAALLYVVNHTGSTPGKQGFKMLITLQGDQLGTIGGGIMEQNMITQAKRKLLDNMPKISFITQAHHEHAPKEHQSGLICAGTQYIVIQLVTKDDQDRIDYIADSYQTDQDGILVLNQNGLDIVHNRQLPTKYEFTEDENWQFKEYFGDPATVYVFGGGHVGKAITQALSMLDFYVVLNDNRPDLEMVTENKFAHEIKTGSYTDLAQQTIPSKNSYIVIVTYGFDHDAEVLSEVINKDFAYIGLMGSSAKLRRIFNLMREQGINEKLIENVHAPIGLDIANETAEEIAISVAAQLIDIKNN